MKRLISTLLITILAGAAEKLVAAPYDAAITEAQAQDIAEATFRYQFAHNLSAQKSKGPGLLSEAL